MSVLIYYGEVRRGVGCVLLYWWKEGSTGMEWPDFLVGVARGLRGRDSGARTSSSDEHEGSSGDPGGGEGGTRARGRARSLAACTSSSEARVASSWDPLGAGTIYRV